MDSHDIIPAAGVATPVLSPQQAVEALTQRQAIIQTVMREVMRKDVDYGQVPGTQGLSLYKPGAEKLGVIFGLAPRYDVADLSENGEVTYRVTCELYSRETGLLLGSGLGECSSLEEKYAWRSATGKPEFNETAADRRRVKHTRGGKSFDQVRQDPANVRHTVLSQASKRALVGATRAVTGASDMFADGSDSPAAAAVLTGPVMLQYLISLAQQKGVSEQDILSKVGSSCSDGTLASLPYIKAEQVAKSLAKKPDVVDGVAIDDEDDAAFEALGNDDETPEDEGQQSLGG
jgi:hypothetical protein